MNSENTEIRESNPDDAIPSTKAERYIHYALNAFNMGVAEDGHFYLYPRDNNNAIARSLRGAWLKRWLRKKARDHGEIITADDMKDVLDNLEGHAAYSEERIKVYLRTGRSEEGYAELDLGSDDLARVRFKQGVAELVRGGSDTLFYRPDTMLALPVPADDGDWKAILPFLNMSDDHKYLIIGWMTWCLCHERFHLPYPILVVQGPQGMGKSFLSKHVIRRLVDNNASGIQVYRGQAKDMAISAAHQYVLIYDNVRQFTLRQSDDLCVFSTSGTLSGRKLYTDDGQSLLKVHCAIVLNGIHNFIVESDLASRVVTIHVLPLGSKQRVEEEKLKADLEALLPVIFRGLLDLCAEALHIVDSVEVTHPERMLNFCQWLAALEQVMGLKRGSLQKAYFENLKHAAMESVQESALAITVLRFATNLPDKHWIGTPTELLFRLEELVKSTTTNRHSEWPQSPISLSKRLKQIAAPLKAQGVDIAFSHGTKRQIEVTYVPPENTSNIDLIEEPDDSCSSIPGDSGLAACATN